MMNLEKNKKGDPMNYQETGGSNKQEAQARAK